jgi:hypothetical protein
MKELFYPSDTIDPTAIPIILDEDKDGVVNVCFFAYTSTQTIESENRFL